MILAMTILMTKRIAIKGGVLQDHEAQQDMSPMIVTKMSVIEDHTGPAEEASLPRLIHGHPHLQYLQHHTLLIPALLCLLSRVAMTNEVGREDVARKSPGSEEGVGSKASRNRHLHRHPLDVDCWKGIHHYGTSLVFIKIIGTDFVTKIT